jgi:hypothetical protein
MMGWRAPLRHLSAKQVGAHPNLGASANKIRHFLQWNVSWKSAKRQQRDMAKWVG